MTSRKILQRWIDVAECCMQQGLIPRYFSVAFLVGSQKARETEQTRVWQQRECAAEKAVALHFCSASAAFAKRCGLPALKRVGETSSLQSGGTSFHFNISLQLLLLQQTRNSTKIFRLKNFEDSTGSQQLRVEAKQVQRGCSRSTRGASFRSGKAFGSDTSH